MSTRIFFAGILGGIVMFIWNFVAHDLLPLGEMGVRVLPNEDTITSALQTNLADNSGFYIFPSGGLSPGATGEQKTSCDEKGRKTNGRRRRRHPHLSSKAHF